MTRHFLKDDDLSPAEQAEVLAAEARFLAMRGQIDAAKDRLRRSLAQDQHFGHREGTVRALALLGRLEQWSGRPEHAVSHFTDAVTLGEMNESWEPLGAALCGLGEFQRWQGEYSTSIATLHKAFEIASEHGNVDLWVEVLLEMAETHLAAGSLDLAAQRAAEASQLARDLGHTLWDARSEFVEGQIAVRRGSLAGIEQMDRAAERIGESPYSFPFGVSVIERLGRSLREIGRTDEATNALDRARKLAEEYGLVRPRV